MPRESYLDFEILRAEYRHVGFLVLLPVMKNLTYRDHITLCRLVDLQFGLHPTAEHENDGWFTLPEKAEDYLLLNSPDSVSSFLYRMKMKNYIRCEQLPNDQINVWINFDKLPTANF